MAFMSSTVSSHTLSHICANVPCVMLRSFPTAKLHTLPRTLGGMPCHQRSLTRRDVHLPAERMKSKTGSISKTNKVKLFGISLQKFLTMWVILWIILILWGAIIKKYTYRTKTYSRGRLLQINFYRNTDYIFKKNWGRAPSIGRKAIVRYTNLDFNILFIFVTVEKLGMKTCSHKCFTDKRGVLCTTMSWELLCTTIIKKRFQSESYTLEWLSHSAGKTGCHFHYCVTDHYVITQLSLPDAEIKHKMPSI